MQVATDSRQNVIGETMTTSKSSGFTPFNRKDQAPRLHKTSGFIVCRSSPPPRFLRQVVAGSNRMEEMDSRTCWIVSLTIVVCFVYLYATKPSCRDGFTPVIGGGTGWYCAPGYLP